MRRQGAPAVLAVAAALVALAGCGEDEKRYNDAKIVERLDLEKTGDGYAIDGDPFCAVEGKLLNDAEEVDAAVGDDELGLVVSSRAGNAGVKGVPPFGPDCGDAAKKGLNKLDPAPKEE